MAYEKIVNAFLETMKFDVERSRLSMGGTEVSFHCDKFNTRILKNFEDVLGYDDAAQLLFEMADKTTYDAFKKVLTKNEKIIKEFRSFEAKEQLEAFCELFKVLAYGALIVKEATPERAVYESSTSYLAEGWIENQQRWQLDERDGEACHDLRGHIAAIMALVYDKVQGSYRVKETECRAYKNGKKCMFIAEVKK